MSGWHTWVINLDRAPERLARVAGRLDTLGIAWTRLPAVDARAFTDAERAQLDEPAYRRLHGMAPLPGELGCYLSHHVAMQRFLASDAEAAVILEDDVQLRDTLPAVVEALLRIPQRWDMVKLSAVHSGTPVAVAALDGAARGHRLAVMLSRCTGSSAYLVNRRAAAVYRDRLLPMRLPYDHVFDQAWRFGLKVRLVTPTPCVHDDQAASTIGAPGAGVPSRKFHWSRRLTTHAYRLGNELRRLGHGLASVAAERLHG